MTENTLNQIRLDAIINGLTQQRNSALTEIVRLAAEVAVRDAQIKQLSEENPSEIINVPN